MKTRLKTASAVTIPFCSLVSLNCYAASSLELRAAALLLQHFETVAYTRAAISSGVDAPNTSAGTLRFPFIYLVGGLRTLGPNTLDRLRRSYGSIFVGAKDFAPPEGLGGVSSRDCYIGLLNGGKQPDLASAFRKAKTDSIAGQQVWTWNTPPYEGHPQPTTFYFAQIGDSYFVMTNHREDFQEVVSELTSAKSSQVSPVTIPGWKTFSAYKYWAYRSIRRSGITKADAYASGLMHLPSNVVAFAFFADMDTNESYFQVYSSDITKTMPADLPLSNLVRFQSAGPGVWQATIPLPQGQTGNQALFAVFSYFGFGVFV